MAEALRELEAMRSNASAAVSFRVASWRAGLVLLAISPELVFSLSLDSWHLKGARIKIFSLLMSEGCAR